DDKANVHTGWLVSLAHLAPGIVRKLNEYYKEKKVREVLVMGHSQGGGIAFLLRSYLEYARQQQLIPGDLFFKTYCSAGPKPGNMYYAYDYDFITRGGWGFNVVNSADWVPEVPFSIQTLANFNPTNVFVNTKKMLKKQKFFVRLIGNHVYNKMEKKPRKAQRRYEKYLGHKIYKIAIKKALPGLKEPDYVHDNNYMRAGTPVILLTNPAYYTLFPENPDKPFTHHMFQAYFYLLKQHYGGER
ncbi:MAG: lipase family protein, partial [Sphingobacteriales bacterium]